MAEPVYPNNQTRFPAYPEPGAGPPAEPHYSNLSPASRTPTRSSLAYNPLAEKVGDVVGSAIESVKSLPDRLQEMKQRFTVIRGRAQEDLAARASDVAGDVKERASDLRSRAQRMAREDPLRFIARAAVAGAVMGIVLRIWRDHAE